MGAGEVGTTGAVVLAIGIVLLAGCGDDDVSDLPLDDPAETGAVARCEVLARGELPDDIETDESLADVIAMERERCREIGIELAVGGGAAASSGTGADGGDDGAGSAGDGDGARRSDGGAQDDTALEDDASADATGDLDDAPEGADRTLTELARVYCDIRSEVESYPTQPPQPVEDRLEAQSLELFAALEAIGSGLQDLAFQVEAHRLCPEWVPDPTR